MSRAIFQIVYCSRNTIDPAGSDTAIAQILATSRRNNAAAGVTGALLYNNGIFVQTLEGKFDAVQTIFERIQGDERHEDVVMLQSQNVDTPMFGEWAMAFAEPTDKAMANRLLAQAMVDPSGGAYHQVLELLDQVVRHQLEWSGTAA